MRRVFAGVLALAALVACRETPAPAPTPSAAAVQPSARRRLPPGHAQPTPSATPVRTSAPVIAATPAPTHAPSATPSALPAPTLAPTPVPTAQTLSAVLPAPSDPPPIGNASSGSVVGNGAPGGTAATPGPTPTPTPAQTLGALPNTYVFWGLTGSDNANGHISPPNVSAWLYACQGAGSSTAIAGGDSGGAHITQCPKSYFYVSLNMLQAHTNGALSTQPWTGNLANGSSAIGGAAGETCPSDFTAADFAALVYNASTHPYAPNFTSTSNTVNWGVYDGPIGNPADQIGAWSGAGTGQYWRIYTNWNSTGVGGMLPSLNAVLQNCAYQGIAYNAFTGVFEDNLYAGLQSAGWTLWGPFAYNLGANWGGAQSSIPASPSNGCGNTTPCYADPSQNGGPGNGTTFFNNATYGYTRTTLINSDPYSAGSTTYPADSGGTSSVITGMKNLIPGLVHKDGVTKFEFTYNDLVNGYAACQVSNGITNVTLGEKENPDDRGWGDGRPQSLAEYQSTIDTASDLYACGGTMYSLLDDVSSTNYDYNGTTITNGSTLGTPAYEMQLRQHFGMLWLNWNDKYPGMMVSFLQICNGCEPTTQTWTDILGANFFSPWGRVTPYPAQALGASQNYCGVGVNEFDNFNGTNCANTHGGSLDTNIAVSPSTGGACTTAPSCVFRAVFSHATVENQDKPTVTLSAVTGTSPGSTVYVTATCLSASNGFEGFYAATQSLALTSAQQAQVIVASGTPNCSFYNVYASTASAGPYHLQNLSPIAAGGSYLVPGTLSTATATPPCGANFSRAVWNTTCTHDVGPFVVLANLSGSTMTLSAANLQAALGTSTYTQLNYLLIPGCKPLAGLTSSTAGTALYPSDGISGSPSTTVQCAAKTYEDVYNGNAMGATAIGPTIGTTLLNFEMAFYSKGQP